MDALQHRHQLEAARLLHLRIRRPGANRELEISDRDVLEPGILHLFLQYSTAHDERHAQDVRGGFLVLAPLADVAVAREGLVVGAGVDGDFLGFDPAAGFAVSVGKHQWQFDMRLEGKGNLERRRRLLGNGKAT